MNEDMTAQAPPDSAGAVIVRSTAEGWRLLLLRAYQYWEFPKGLIVPG